MKDDMKMAACVAAVAMLLSGCGAWRTANAVKAMPGPVILEDMPDTVDRKVDVQQYSPTTLIVMYESGRHDAVRKAVEKYGCEVIYDYNIIKGLAVKKPDGKTLDETANHLKSIKGVLSVERDAIMHLD